MSPDLRKRLLAILAADVAGYSRLMAIDDQATVSMLDSARAVFRNRVGAHGGRIIDMAGDSVLAVFETASGAMSAALAVQRILGRSSAEVPAERQLRFRIGIHVGDVIEKDDGSVYGDGVNIAARLEGLAEPGCVAISQGVHGMVARSADAEFEDTAISLSRTSRSLCGHFTRGPARIQTALEHAAGQLGSRKRPVAISPRFNRRW